MLGLLGFLGGMFALIWAGIAASIGLAVLFALLVPLLVLVLFFRLSLMVVKIAAAFVLVCFLAAWMF